MLRVILLRDLKAIAEGQLGKVSKNLGLIGINLRRAEQAKARLEAICPIGHAIRKSEKGWPMRDVALARAIAKRIGTVPMNTVRGKLKALRLDYKHWAEIAAAKNPVKRNLKKSKAIPQRNTATYRRGKSRF